MNCVESRKAFCSVTGGRGWGGGNQKISIVKKRMSQQGHTEMEHSGIKEDSSSDTSKVRKEVVVPTGDTSVATPAVLRKSENQTTQMKDDSALRKRMSRRRAKAKRGSSSIGESSSHNIKRSGQPAPAV